MLLVFFREAIVSRSGMDRNIHILTLSIQPSSSAIIIVINMRDIKAFDVNVDSWEELANDRSLLRQELGSVLQRGEAKR